MTSLSRTIFPVLCIAFLLASTPVFAQSESPIEADETHAVTKAIDASTKERISQKELIVKTAGDTISKALGSITRSLIELAPLKKQMLAQDMPFYYELNDIIIDRVTSSMSEDSVSLTLSQIMHNMMAGHEIVEGVSVGNQDNPLAGTSAASDVKIYEILTTTFCNPESTISPRSCRERTLTPQSRQNFVDMFVGERTWGDKTIVDALLVARRFFASAGAREIMGTMDEGNFLANRSEIARSNMRMAILNDLAARRAPTSTATKSVLEFMFTVLASSTPFVGSVDSEEACSAANLTLNESDSDEARAMKFINGYVCSFTSSPTNTGDRIMSQAAIDRIMQHDLYLSSEFYGQIYSPDVGENALDKMEVFMKAQQLTQDYRQLRLLQMKVAARAMNVMNGK